jgi:UDPglucose--hexose-1-phosphate uridylyltransferase
VVITTDHPRGPEDYLSFKPPYNLQEGGTPCPFCPGNEAMTPTETFLFPDSGKGWSVRVIPNKFPFFHIEGGFERRAEGMYDVMEAVGAHEIVVETPDHDQQLATIEPDHIEKIFLTSRQRMIDLAKDPRFQQILLLKNHPGVINRHPHSHIMAMPVIPKGIDEEIQGTLDYYQRKERCIFCDIVREEISDKKRVILETVHFLVFSPFASRYPFEAWIVPKVHSPDFHRIRDEEMRDLSSAIQTFFYGIHQLLSDPPYSLTVHTSPVQTRFHRPEYHWHIEVRLRIGLREGFEWGTGFYINPTPPEDAAAHLRRVL